MFSSQYGKHKNDIPDHLHIDHIDSGYRCPEEYNTLTKCLKSLFEFHNETISVWIMIIASMVSIMLTIKEKDVALKVLTLSAVLHLPFCVLNHIANPIDRNHNYIYRKLDVIAIFLVSILVTFSLGYHTIETKYLIILMLISMLICLMSSYYILTHDNYDLESVDRITHTVGVGLAVAVYLIPMFIATYKDRKHLSKLLTVLGAFGTGALFFACGIPERFIPGGLDLVGNSHQLMHITLLIAHIAKIDFIKGFL